MTGLLEKENSMADRREAFDRRVSQLAERIYNEQVAALRTIGRIDAKGPQQDAVPPGCTTRHLPPGRQEADQWCAAWETTIRTNEIFSALLLQKAQELGVVPLADDDSITEWILGPFRSAYYRSLS